MPAGVEIWKHTVRMRAICICDDNFRRELHERAIYREEVREAAQVMKSSKAPGLDEFPVECLKKEVWKNY